MHLSSVLFSSPLGLRYRTAIEALASLDRGECDLAGFQVSEGEYELPILKRYCPWLNSDRHRLIHLAVRNTGLFVKRSEEHTSELQSLMRISYAVFCLKKKYKTTNVTY